MQDPADSAGNGADEIQAYKKKCVRAYTKAGITLFQCCIKKNKRGIRKKQPRWRGWKNTAFNPKQKADMLGTMYGVLTNDELIVLDADPRRYEPGEDQLSDLFRRFKIKKIDTFIVKSGGKGYHVYLRKPKEVRVLSDVPGYGGIEIKAKGRWVAAAGSIHENGNQYRVFRGSPAHIADCPPDLLEYIRNKELEEDSDAEDRTVDDEVTKRRYVKYLESADPAIEGMGGDAHTFAVAAEGRRFGLSQETVLDLMLDHFNDRCEPPWEPEELKQKVGNAFAYGQGSAGDRHPLSDFEEVEEEKRESGEKHNDRVPKKITGWDRDRQQELKTSLNNAVNFFLLDTVEAHAPNPLNKIMRYNMFSDSIDLLHRAPWHSADLPKPKEWTDKDTVKLKHYLGSKKHVDFPVSTLYEAVIVYSGMYEYHPVRDYLRSIVWDGKPRLDTMLHVYAGAEDSAYVREVSKNTMIAAVARVENPGCKHDSILVLEGPQGKYKSSFVSTLGGDWAADVRIDPHDKDTVQNIQGKWFIEASEMEFTRRTEIQAQRAFITRTVDRIRPSYERSPRDLPRQGVILGTVNPDPDGYGYLNDPTGNRRFWPVLISRIDLEKLKCDRDQLFAEAFVRYKKGEPYHIVDPQIQALAEIEQSKRCGSDIWDGIIAAWLIETKKLPNPLTSAAIAVEAIGLAHGQLNKIYNQRIGSAMRKAGYSLERKRYKRLGQLHVWHRPEDDI